MLINVILALGSLVLALGLMELIFRITPPGMGYSYMPQQIRVSHFRPSELLPFELVPNLRTPFYMAEFDTTVATNSLGLRGPEIDYDRPRILCMGDSFTFGFGVENDETYCARLEQLFAGRYQFVNAGFADGYSPDTYAVWLRARGKALRPQGIIVQLFQNDYREVFNNRWLRGGEPMMTNEPGMPDRITRPGLFVTADGAWLRDSLIARLPPWLRRLIKRSYIVALFRDRFLRDAEVHDPVDGRTADKPRREGGDEKFLHALDMLREMADDRLLFLYLVHPSRSSSPMYDLVTEFAARHRIRVISNAEEFSSDDRFPLDGHWNARGHQIAAKFLYRELSQLGY